MRLYDRVCPPLLGVAMALGLSLAAMGAHADIVVAATSNLNGGPILRGVESAVDFLNKSGGLLGQKLRLVPFDAGCDERQSRELANRVLRQEPALVVGLECSDGAIAASPVYAAGGVIQISALSSNPRLTESGIPTVFRVLGRDDAQGFAAAALIARKWRTAGIAVISDETFYGRDLAKYAREGLSRNGIDIALELQAKSAGTTYADIVRVLKEKHIEVAYITFSAARDLGLLLRELSKSDLKLKVLTGDMGAAIGRWSGGVGGI